MINCPLWSELKDDIFQFEKVQGKDDSANFQVDACMDLSLQESAKRIFPLCESYLLINQFVESRSQFRSGLVNHAFAAALRTLLLVGFSPPNRPLSFPIVYSHQRHLW